MYLRAAFSISLVTYVLLILAEAFQPGFVSNYFSAHWLLLVVLTLFILLTRRGAKWSSVPVLEWLVVLILAVIFVVVTWKLGRSLEELRILISLIAFLIPFGLLGVIKQS